MKETNPRPPKSVVSTTCEGELINLGSLATMDPQGTDLCSAQNPLDLVLCRGAGKCSIDFTIDDEVEKWKDKKICASHLHELYSGWHLNKYGHISRKTTAQGHSEVCSMPHSTDSIWTTHSQGKAPIVKRRHVLEKPEAEAILELHGTLIHPGIPLCKKHQQFAKETLADMIVKQKGRTYSPPVPEKQRSIKEAISRSSGKVPEKVSLRDAALGMFINRIESIDTTRTSVFNREAEDDISSTYNDQTEDLPVGWALRPKRQSSRFSEDVKNYLKELYIVGEQSSKHYDPKEVPQMMAVATHSDGTRRFLPSERLNWRQVASFFSRMKEERRLLTRGRRSVNADGSGLREIEDLDDFEFYFLKDEYTETVEDHFYREIEKAHSELFN